MLDQLNHLNQFQVNAAWEQLALVFQPNFLAEAPEFSGLEVIFHSQQPSLGLKIALDWLDNTQFQWQATTSRAVAVDGETWPLPEMPDRLGEWRDLLLCLKLAGIDIHSALQEVKNITDQLAPAVITRENKAKQLALRLAGKVGLVLTARQLELVGEWWRRALEQQAANLCFSQTINQINYRGWQSHPVDKPFGVIDIVNHQDQTAFDKKNRQLSGKMPAAYQLKPTANQPAAQLLELIILAEATSFYLAVLNKQSLGR